MQSALNYLWQLRPYSYSDLVLLLLACGANGRQMVGISLLWFGFLIHLEWQHKDRGRLRWHWMAWIIPWMAAIYLIWEPIVVLFFVFAILYSLKKRVSILSPFSFMVNGSIKAALVALIPGVGLSTILTVGIIMAIRNLIGDIRDAQKDYVEGVKSLPVVFGYKRDTAFVYPAFLIATSVLWTIRGAIPWWALTLAIVIQLGTYRLTPR